MMFKGSRILITGGSGTLGKEFARQLLEYDCKEIIIFSRSEVTQVEMKRSYPNLTYMLGDVRDRNMVRESTRGIDVVFHLAAIKHVSICENQPEEAVKTNIFGTQNIASFAKKLIFMSTDKAVTPTSVYGYTKAIAESIVLRRKGIIIRSGNIYGSSGSVIPLFINQVRTKNTITLTNGEMTRFFIPVDKLVLFILKQAEIDVPGIYFPLNIPAFKMRDIAEAIKEFYGNESTKIIEIGALASEKMHESLDGIHYSNDCLSSKDFFKETFLKV